MPLTITDPYSWVEDKQICAKLKAANFTIFAAIVCADVSFEKMCTAAKAFAWVWTTCSLRSWRPSLMLTFQ